MPRIRKTLDTLSEIIKKWKVAIYIRLSKDDGNDESYSVKNQRERLNDYFNDLAANEDVEFIDYYIDDGFTGVDSDRDDFQRLLTDVQKKKVNCIIVKDLSRMGRAVFCLIEPEPCCGHLHFECSSLSANQRFQNIYDLAVLNVGGIGKLLAVLFPHGFEFSAGFNVAQNGGHIRNLPGCTAMGCGGV